MNIKLETAPSSYPITLAEAKAHLNIDNTDHDTYVKTLLRAATGRAEQFLHRRLVAQTWKYYLNLWPSGTSFKLPFGRLQSVTAIKYKDENGDESTFSSDDYIVDMNNPISVEFTCGYYIGDTWVKETVYPLNSLIVPVTENGLVYKCTTALTSSATEPTWPLTIGDTVADGADTTEGVWTCLGMAVPEPIRHAIKLTISDLFEYRETEISGMNQAKLRTFEDLLFPYKLFGEI